MRDLHGRASRAFYSPLLIWVTLLAVAAVALFSLAESRAADQYTQQLAEQTARSTAATEQLARDNRRSITYIEDCATPSGKCYQQSVRSEELIRELRQLANTEADADQDERTRNEALQKTTCDRIEEFARAQGVRLMTPCPPPLTPDESERKP